MSNVISQTKNVGDIYIWQIINFDTTFKYISIDTSINNIWIVGTPQKTYFNSAYSPNKAILTDTLHFYPVNNYSYFDLFITRLNTHFTFKLNIFVDFWHKYDTDTLRDGGYVSISWNNGQTWNNVINDNNYMYCHPTTNFYTNNNKLYNGESGFSGRSNGWIHSIMAWYAIPTKLSLDDTMIIRFSFISDSINNPREGWMIDNIKLYSVEIGGGIENIQSTNFFIYPNPTSNNITIETNTNTNKSLEIINIVGQTIYTSAVNNKKTIDVSNFPKGIYVLKLYTDKGIIVKKFIKE